jgi:glycosyltransferase involved in cell wall biosynthesis
VKADYFARADNGTADMHALVHRFPEIKSQIRIVTGRLSLGEMASLYLAADVFVFPSKGEGWGLPLIEALAAGVPTISTIHSGHSHYVDGCRSQVAVIQHTLTDIDDAKFKQIWHGEGSLGQWAVPSVDSIAAHMRAVYNDYALHQSLARQASDYVRRNFSWSNSAHEALNQLGVRGLLRSVVQIE